jgi:transcriptional regulator with XRE-family HTH domain
VRGEEQKDSDYARMAASQARRLLKQEELILEATEALSRALRDSRSSKAALARSLGRSKAFVSQVFGGGRNLTLRTMADIADALGYEISIRASPAQDRVPLRVVSVAYHASRRGPDVQKPSGPAAGMAA